MSSTTIADPTGETPVPAYQNDINITDAVLLNVENSNIAKSKGLLKLNMYFDPSVTPDLTTTQTIPSGTDTTSTWKNLLRTEIPATSKLIRVNAAASKFGTLDGSNYYTVSVERSTYTTSNIIPEANWSSLGSFTINGTTLAALTEDQSFNQSFAAGDSFRFKLTVNGSPDAHLQLTAVFNREHS